MWRFRHYKVVARVIGDEVVGTQGTPVELLVTGMVRPLAGGIELSAYRYNIGGGGVGVTTPDRAPQEEAADTAGLTFLRAASDAHVPILTGFVNSETVVSAGITLSGLMAFNGSTATSVKNVGTYTQTVGTLTMSVKSAHIYETELGLMQRIIAAT